MVLAGGPRAAGGGGGAQVDAGFFPWIETYDAALGTNPSAYGSANAAHLQRVRRRAKRLTTTKVSFVVGVASGNVDIGIYTRTGAGEYTRQASTGSTAIAGTNALQTLDLPFTWEPDTDYWIAIAVNNTTTTIGAQNPGFGTLSSGLNDRMVQIGSSFPLPATITNPTPVYGTNRWVIAYTPGV